MNALDARLAGRAPAPLRIYLLGRFEVIRGEAPIPATSWRRRRPADLLKLVSLTPEHAIDRDEAIARLWPDKDLASGANNLHRALYDLRQVVGPGWVDIERGVIQMRPDAWVDVVAFETALERADPASVEPALALYRGDLSPEDRESEWLVAPRERLRDRFATAALPLAHEATARGELGKAIPLLRRVADAQPRHEDAALLLVRLLAESGRRGEALRVYEGCEAALRAAGRAPGTDLRALRDAIQRGEVGPPQIRAPYDGSRRSAQRLLGAADPPPLRGRAAALLLVESLVEQGAGTVVLLGEVGVGKTRLALEGARLAQERGALVLAGSAAAPGALPFGPFADAFGDWARSGGGPHDPFEGATPADLAGGRILDAVRTALSGAGGRATYLLLDDLQLADEPSASLFHVLAREARALRLVLVGTCREEAVRAGTPVQALLAHLDCERLARGVRVQRLDLAATRAQIGDVLGEEPAEALATQLYRLSDGSPFYTEELARSWAELRRLPATPDPAAPIRERVARLGPRAGALLAAAAACGTRFDLDLLRPAAQMSAHDALAAIDACLASRILEEDATGWRFRHALVREAVYAAIPAPRRAELHRALAGAIAERAAASPEGTADAAEPLARHLLAAGEPGRALPHLLAAAHRAAGRGASAEALARYAEASEAAQRAGAPAAHRVEILEGQGEVQLALGDVSGALSSFEAAASLASQDRRARLHRLAGLALVAAGRADEALPRLQDAARDADAEPGEAADTAALVHAVEWHLGLRDDAFAGPDPAHDPRPEVLLALWERSLTGDATTQELEARAARFLARAQERGAEAAAAVGRAVEGALSARAGRWDLADSALREAARRARAAGSALVEVFALEHLGTLLTVRGRAEEGLAAIGDGLLAAERALQRRHALVRLYAALARNRAAAGALYAAEDAIREASATAARHDGCVLCDAVFRPQAVRVAIRRGRLPDAEQEAAQLEAIAAHRGGAVLRLAARDARAAVLAAQGRDGEAAGAAAEAEALCRTLGIVRSDASPR